MLLCDFFFNEDFNIEYFEVDKKIKVSKSTLALNIASYWKYLKVNQIRNMHVEYKRISIVYACETYGTMAVYESRQNIRSLTES